MGRWQVISPVQVKGQVVYVDVLSTVQNTKYSVPTIIIAKRVSGEEDIPVGCVGVVTPDMPDILSHVSVRARNEKVFFATVFDFNVLEEMKQMDGKCVSLHPNAQGDEIDVKSIKLADVQPTGGAGASEVKTLGESGISIKQKQWRKIRIGFVSIQRPSRRRQIKKFGIIARTHAKLDSITSLGRVTVWNIQCDFERSD